MPFDPATDSHGTGGSAARGGWIGQAAHAAGGSEVRMAVGGVFVLIAVAFVAATGGFFVGVMQRNRRRTRGFLVGFCCGWLTGAVLRGRRRGLRAVTALVRR